MSNLLQVHIFDLKFFLYKTNLYIYCFCPKSLIVSLISIMDI